MNPENPSSPNPVTETPTPVEKPVASPNPETLKHYRYGGFMTRYFATFIDGIIVFLSVGAVGILLSLLSGGLEKGNTQSPVSAILNVVQVLLYFVSPIYTIYFLHKTGSTPGKRALHLKVVSVSDEPLSVGRLILREVVGKMISGFFGSLGYFWYLFDEKRQAWHDKIAHTIVLDTREISEEAYQVWKAKQKSALPLFLILAAVTPLFFMLVVYGITQIPQYKQFVLPVFPLASTLTTTFMIILGINVITEMATGVWLYKQQITSPFLEGKPTKIGIGIYLFFQVFVTFAIIVGGIAVVIFFASKFSGVNTDKSMQLNQDTFMQQYDNLNQSKDIYDGKIPSTTLHPTPPVRSL